MNSTNNYQRNLTCGESLMLAQLSVKAGTLTDKHQSETEEIIFVAKGELKVYVAASEITLKAGQSLVVPAATFYTAEAVSDTDAIVFSKKSEEWITTDDFWSKSATDQFLWAV